jgi:hypothetical protein
MSSTIPPTYYFSGINFNPSFYDTVESSGLTQGEANLLYLKKTVPDTATSIETFSAGIISPSVDSSGTNNPISIGASQTTGVLNIGTGVRTTGLNGGAINIGNFGSTAGPINIGTSNTAITISGLVHQNGAINSLNSTSGTMRLGFTQTTGTIEVGNGTTRGLGNFGGVINIGNASTYSFPINIGNCASTNCQTNIGNLNVTNATKTATLTTNSIDTTTAGNLTIGGTNCSGVSFADNIALTLTSDLTLGTGQIYLGNCAALRSAGALGRINVNGFGVVYTFSSVNTTTIWSKADLGVGVWLGIVRLNVTSSATTSMITIGMGPSANSYSYGKTYYPTNGLTQFTIEMTVFFTNLLASYGINLCGFATFTGAAPTVNVTDSMMNFVRIA